MKSKKKKLERKEEDTLDLEHEETARAFAAGYEAEGED